MRTFLISGRMIALSLAIAAGSLNTISPSFCLSTWLSGSKMSGPKMRVSDFHAGFVGL